MLLGSESLPIGKFSLPFNWVGCLLLVGDVEISYDC